jgi:hypothetical protein
MYAGKLACLRKTKKCFSNSTIQLKSGFATSVAEYFVFRTGPKKVFAQMVSGGGVILVFHGSFDTSGFAEQAGTMHDGMSHVCKELFRSILSLTPTPYTHTHMCQ